PLLLVAHLPQEPGGGLSEERAVGPQRVDAAGEVEVGPRPDLLLQRLAHQVRVRYSEHAGRDAIGGHDVVPRPQEGESAPAPLVLRLGLQYSRYQLARRDRQEVRLHATEVVYGEL